jgi:hypothetical protein
MSRPGYSIQVKDSEERADRIASDRPVDGPQAACPVAAELDRDRRGAARLAQWTRSRAPLADSFARWRR